MKSHDYIPRPAKIIKKTQLRGDVVSLRIRITDKKPFHFSPGQYVMLSVLGFGEVPIGITTSPLEKIHFEVAVRDVGLVTQKICALSEGDGIGVSGPFGNGFPMSSLCGKDVVIVAGGIGLAPLRSFIRHIGKKPNLVKSLTILNGARCPEELLYFSEYKKWEEFASLHLTVDRCDSSWKGCVGIVTKLFDKAEVKRGSVMIVCGPPVMFRPTIERYADKRIAESDLYLLLERRMKCGIGKCQHCTCGDLYVCKDGPIFSYSKLKYNKEAFL